jgi:CubicO group peptidase (beta-lactamase class C family)
MRLIRCLIVIIYLTPAAYGQSVNEKLDSLFNLLHYHNKAMGSFVISRNGSVVYNKVIGYRYYTAKDKIASDVNTKYRIGSVSKLFTATIIFQLIEEGRLSLSNTLADYFPGLPNADLITISHLLNHRSGIQNFRSINGKQEPKTHEEILKTIYDAKSEFTPGTRASYSNANYVLLGYLVEKICEKPFADILNDRIISKIDLKNTYCGSKTDPDRNESYSYKFKNSWQEQQQTDMSITGGTGAIVSTPTDLTRFIENLFSYKLVSQQSLEKMKIITDGYGMGMIPLPFYDKMGYGHYGGIDNFISVVAYFPEEGTAIAYCTNGEVYPVKDILETALSIYFGKEYTVPDFKNIGYQEPGKINKEQDLISYLEIK